MGLLNDVKKYRDYIFDTRSFNPKPGGAVISEQALETARSIRGLGRAPALIIHGVMPRSGTVYVGELLRLHPDLYAYPNEIWELPFLRQTEDLLKVQRLRPERQSPSGPQGVECALLTGCQAALAQHIAADLAVWAFVVFCFGHVGGSKLDNFLPRRTQRSPS